MYHIGTEFSFCSLMNILARIPEIGETTGLLPEGSIYLKIVLFDGNLNSKIYFCVCASNCVTGLV